MENAFQLKVRLADIEPEIWRRIVVPASLTLTELHAVIQGAMGWQDSHLHMFEIDGQRFEIPEDDGLKPEEASEDERKHTLKALLSKDMQFAYVYDFGDDWMHEIMVEKTDDIAAGEKLPRCVAGARACPPEDCGGPFAFPELLDALADPKHPDHGDMRDWAGDFEPEAFSVAQANADIKAISALYRRRKWGFR